MIDFKIFSSRPWQPRKTHPRPSQGSLARVSLLEADAKAASSRSPKLSTGQLSLRGMKLSRGSSTKFRCVVLRRTHVGNARRRMVDLASSLTPCEVGKWTQAVRNARPVLLGQIFAYFTTSKSGQSYKHVVGDAQDESDLAEGVLLKAHNIQILTILRLLGYDSCATETDVASQIRTGERKSIILGACSVRCVCYSNFLIHRDYSLFETLFTAFGIAKRVYSKITKFSEAVVTKGDIRQVILDLIEGRSLDTSSGRPSNPQQVGEEILLVDEGEVSLSQNLRTSRGSTIHGQALSPHTADGRVQGALGEILGLGDPR